jgi:hypothetical protein
VHNIRKLHTHTHTHKNKTKQNKLNRRSLLEKIRKR